MDTVWLCVIIVCAAQLISGTLYNCGTGSSMCRSVQKCVSDSQRCDGINDCGDWSDEDTCPEFTCPGNLFQCSDGPCIPKLWKCDDENDCQDGSDEQNCNAPCSTGTSMCRSVQKCVADEKRCDGVNDCGDWSDEDTCPGAVCPRDDEFHCSDGPCIPSMWKCDDDPDCVDGSDEIDCN